MDLRDNSTGNLRFERSAMYESRLALRELHLVENPICLLSFLPHTNYCHVLVFDDLRDAKFRPSLHSNNLLLPTKSGHLLHNISAPEVQRRWERCGQRS